jgi:hypothetical protein
MIPQLRSFRGKSRYSTVTCLSERLSGLKTNVTVATLQQISKLAGCNSSHASATGEDVRLLAEDS